MSPNNIIASHAGVSLGTDSVGPYVSFEGGISYVDFPSVITTQPRGVSVTIAFNIWIDHATVGSSAIIFTMYDQTNSEEIMKLSTSSGYIIVWTRCTILNFEITDLSDRSWTKIAIAYNDLLVSTAFLALYIDDRIIFKGRLSPNSLTDIPMTSSIGFLFGSKSGDPSFIGKINHFNVNQGWNIASGDNTCLANCDLGVHKEFCYSNSFIIFSKVLVCSGDMKFHGGIKKCVPIGNPTPSPECTPNMMFPTQCSCPQKFRISNEPLECQQCLDQYCLECPSATTICTLCDPRYTAIDGICLKNCHDFCATCFAPGYDKCTSCESGYYLFQTTCTEICPIGTFPVNDPRTCVSCHPSCESCRDHPNNCIKCKPGFFKQPNGYQSTDSSCQSQCPDGYYGDSLSKSCIPCNSACQTCNDNSNLCTICSGQAYRLDPRLCVFQCPVGYYADPVSRKCSLCDSSCSTCTGPRYNECVSCAKVTQFVRNGVCRNCHQTCYKCKEETRWNCTACLTGFILRDGECIPHDCQAGYYLEYETGKCLKCPSNCKTCESPTVCLSCNRGYIIDRKSVV